MAIFFTSSPTSNHLHPLQVENCDSNSRLVVDEDDSDKFRPERVKTLAVCTLRQIKYRHYILVLMFRNAENIYKIVLLCPKIAEFFQCV